MKKYLSFIAIFILIIFAPVMAAENNIPLRDAIEERGGTAKWNTEDETIHLLLDGAEYVITPNSYRITVNGAKMALTRRVVVTEGRAYISNADFDKLFAPRGLMLSHLAGVYAEAFELTIELPSNPGAQIYWTIDGNEPTPGIARYVTRGDTMIQVSGVANEGRILIQDRTGAWENSMLAHYSDTWYRRYHILPLAGAEMLQGTTLKIRAFENDEPVTDTVTSTFIIAADAAVRFNHRPIISITAPYDEFLYIYANSDPNDGIRRRETFGFEYFEPNAKGEYELAFALPGVAQLGGNYSRSNAQRTFNVHFARGALNGVITHPIFEGVDRVYRMRLWNGGNAFGWDHFRDAFVQKASENLNVPFAESNLAIMFVNGEYWGFTTLREWTSNAEYVSTHFGIAPNNVAIIDRDHAPIDGVPTLFDEVAEGNEAIVWALYEEVLKFVTTHDMSTDYARERFFNEFFDEANFIDYLIANTFFNNEDWPQNNLRFFRAITPNPDSGNPYEDGKWRFILHDMDMASRPGAVRLTESRFPVLKQVHRLAPEINHMFLVLNNPAFAEKFVARAEYVLDNYYHPENLVSVHQAFYNLYRPLLPEMYTRFAFRPSVEESLHNFESHFGQMRNFIKNRDAYYRALLKGL